MYLVIVDDDDDGGEEEVIMSRGDGVHAFTNYIHMYQKDMTTMY